MPRIAKAHIGLPPKSPKPCKPINLSDLTCNHLKAANTLSWNWENRHTVTQITDVLFTTGFTAFSDKYLRTADINGNGPYKLCQSREKIKFKISLDNYDYYVELSGLTPNNGIKTTVLKVWSYHIYKIVTDPFANPFDPFAAQHKEQFYMTFVWCAYCYDAPDCIKRKQIKKQLISKVELPKPEPELRKSLLTDEAITQLNKNYNINTNVTVHQNVQPHHLTLYCDVQYPYQYSTLGWLMHSQDISQLYYNESITQFQTQSCDHHC